MATGILFEPLRLGALSLPNRIVMPALTRMRAGPGGVPTALNAEYYGQRATAGLNPQTVKNAMAPAGQGPAISPRGDWLSLKLAERTSRANPLVERHPNGGCNPVKSLSIWHSNALELPLWKNAGDNT